MKYPLSDTIYRGWYDMPKMWSDYIVSNENACNFHGSEKILNFLLTAQNKTRFDGPKLFRRSFYSMLDFYDRKNMSVQSKDNCDGFEEIADCFLLINPWFLW